MRLIDADALAKELMHEGLGYQYNRIINAPTVDAIPMAWIENYVKNAGFVSVYNVQSVEFMLRKWREEREEECGHQ